MGTVAYMAPEQAAADGLTGERLVQRRRDPLQAMTGPAPVPGPSLRSSRRSRRASRRPPHRWWRTSRPISTPSASACSAGTPRGDRPARDARPAGGRGDRPEAEATPDARRGRLRCRYRPAPPPGGVPGLRRPIEGAGPSC